MSQTLQLVLKENLNSIVIILRKHIKTTTFITKV